MSARTFDDAIRKTHRTADEKAWEREQRRKRRSAPAVTVPETGPCCDRCKHWARPVRDDGFGDCQMVAVVAVVAVGRDKGKVVALDSEVNPMHRYEHAEAFEALRTKPGFQCSRFADRTAPIAAELMETLL